MNEYTMIQKIQIDYLKNATSEQLIILFKQHWTGGKDSISAFAKYANINRGNLSLYLSGKKESSATEKAIRCYLFKVYTQDAHILEQEIKSVPEGILGKINLKPHAIVEKITKLSTVIKSLFFIDCDNDMATMVNEYTAKLNNDTHFIFIVSRKAITSQVSTQLNKPWFSLCRATTQSKNAADVLLTVLVTHLNLTLSTHINFFIVSQDGFIKELLLSFEESDRRCFMGNHTDLSTLFLLSQQDLI